MIKSYFIDKTKENWKEAYLQERRKYIGASDVAGIVGMSPYSSAMKVWFDKVEGSSQSKENIPAELGLFLEPYLRKKFVEKFKKNYDIDIATVELPYIISHDDFPFFTCTLDDTFIHPDTAQDCIIEYKSTSEYKKKEWETEETEEVPVYYSIQVQWQLFVTGWERAFIGVLIGNSRFLIREIVRDEELIQSLKNKVLDFKENFIDKKVMPMADGSSYTDDVIKILYGESSGQILEDSKKIDELRAILGEYDIKKINFDLAKLEVEKTKQQVKIIMAENELALVDGRKISFKNIKKFVPAYSCEYRELRINSAK